MNLNVNSILSHRNQGNKYVKNVGVKIEKMLHHVIVRRGILMRELVEIVFKSLKVAKFVRILWQLGHKMDIY